MRLFSLSKNNRPVRLVLYVLSILLHPFKKIKKGRVLFISYGGTQYSCNPRFISDYLLAHYQDKFEVYWFFRKNTLSYDDLDRRLKIVEDLTLRSLMIFNTAEFVVSNKRILPWVYGWKKKKGQKYIMTWHGGKPLKRIELDAAESLSSSYLRRMKHDSAYCDLFLSESAFTTNLFHKSFMYDGEILEKGSPRNDIFFDVEKHVSIKQHVHNYFGIPNNSHIVLYAPTFRGNYSLKSYGVNWDIVIPVFEKKLGGHVTVLIRLHPNFLNNRIDRSSLFKNSHLIEATQYNDINELMIASDALISDYSSCMFDFAFTRRPCFIYAVDSSQYERGFYFNIRELPFPFAENSVEFVENIERFNNEHYQKRLGEFMENQFGPFDTGHASEFVVDWMLERSREFDSSNK